jgi:hypothetical protein
MTMHMWVKSVCRRKVAFVMAQGQLPYYEKEYEAVYLSKSRPNDRTYLLQLKLHQTQEYLGNFIRGTMIALHGQDLDDTRELSVYVSKMCDVSLPHRFSESGCYITDCMM